MAATAGTTPLPSASFFCGPGGAGISHEQNSIHHGLCGSAGSRYPERLSSLPKVTQPDSDPQVGAPGSPLFPGPGLPSSLFPSLPTCSKDSQEVEGTWFSLAGMACSFILRLWLLLTRAAWGFFSGAGVSHCPVTSGRSPGCLRPSSPVHGFYADPFCFWLGSHLTWGELMSSARLV